MSYRNLPLAPISAPAFTSRPVSLRALSGLGALLLALASLEGCAPEEATTSDGAEVEGRDVLRKVDHTESQAVLDALRAEVMKATRGQRVAFNYTDPAGTFLIHKDYVFFQGIIEGANGNKTPIDYKKTDYAERMADGAFDGVTRNGNFAPTVFALAKRQPSGQFTIVDHIEGPTDNYWEGWLDKVPAALTDIFPFHLASGKEDAAIRTGLQKAIAPTLNQQTFVLSSGEDTFVYSHAGYAFFQGYVYGANDNKTAIDYKKSSYRDAYEAGVLDGSTHNGNFAATTYALLKMDDQGAWSLVAADTLAVGPSDVAWEGWPSKVPEIARDVLPELP